jgi:hypothetical protein
MPGFTVLSNSGNTAAICVHRDRAAVVGEVTAICRSQIQDVQLAIDRLALTRRTTHGATSVIVSRPRQHLATVLDGRGLQLIEDFQLADARRDDFPSPGVHHARGGDRASETSQFIGMFVTTELKQRRLDIDEFG